MIWVWLFIWAIEDFPNFLNQLPSDNNDTQWLVAGIICLLLDIFD